MLIVESTLLTWSALFDLFFAFEYFYKTQEVCSISSFCIPLFALGDDFELWTQYPGSVVPLAMFLHVFCNSTKTSANISGWTMDNKELFIARHLWTINY